MYAFAATHELLQLTPWWASRVPFIPSLTAEGRLGYDVRFDLPGTFGFAQYKLGHFRDRLRLVGDELTPSLAQNQLRDLSHSGIWQFWTTRHQHRLLLRLSSTFEHTYYAAPAFDTQDELHDHFANGSIIASSIVAKVDEFPASRSDNGHRHRIIQPVASPNSVFVCSRVHRLENTDLAQDIAEQARHWPDASSLAMQLEKLWESLPGSKRSRNQMLRQAIKEPRTFLLRSRKELISARTESDLSPRQIDSLKPWEGQIPIARNMEEEFGGKRKLIAKYLLSGLILQSHGIEMSVLRPSELAL